MRVLVVHPGSKWSTADVEAGLCFGLQSHGVEVIRYRLDERLARAKSWLYACWRNRPAEDTPKPTTEDALLQAGLGVLEQALRHQVRAVIVVSAILLHPDVIVLLKRAGLKVFVVFTESPYDHAHESRIAGLVDGCWTHERTALASFREVNPYTSYLSHAWHPERHYTGPSLPGDVPAHDVVFVGSGFPERVSFFNKMDWTGIDLGLYGIWKGFGLKPELEACVRSGPVSNTQAAALYRRAKVGLNLYRRTKTPAESLNPRAYELAACGAFSISEHRRESQEKFGPLVPTFQTPQEAESLLRHWLHADRARYAIRQELPAVVKSDSWVNRGTQVIADMAAMRLLDAGATFLSVSDAALFDTAEAEAGQSTAPASWFQGMHWYMPEGLA